MKRIAFLIPHAEPGGGERMIADLCRKLNRTQFQTFAILPKEGRLTGLLQDSGTEVAHIHFRRDICLGYPPGFGWGSARAIIRQLRQWEIDLLHLNDSYLTLLGGVAGRSLKIPVVLTAHGPWDAHFLIQDILNRFFLKRIWTPLDNITEVVLRRGIIPKSKVRSIPFGVDTSRFSPRDQTQAKGRLGLPPDSIVVTRIARFDRVKDYPTFLEAADLIAKESSKVKFLIVGDVLLDIASEKKSYKEKALRMVAQNPVLKDRVLFLGYQDDVAPIFDATDILVSSSKSESVGFTLLEAMASGRAVVSTDKGGPSRIIAHGLTGLLVPPEDPVSLSQAVLTLINDPGKRERMGHLARVNVVAHFNLDEFAKKMEKEYEDVLKVPQH